MEYEAKLDMAVEFDLANTPRVGRGFLYIFLIQSDWVTPQRKAIEDNLGIFSNRLGDNLLIPIDSESHKKKLRRVLNTKERDEPTLIVSQLHPSEWPTEATRDEIIQLRIGKLKKYSEVVSYFQEFIEALNIEDSNTLTKLEWMDKIQRIKRITKKVPILNIAGVLLSI